MSIKTQQYEMDVNQGKNRMYLKIIGYWKEPDEVPNYISDIKQSVSQLKNGFTILSDVTEMQTPPKTIAQLHQQAQKILVDAGLSKTAEILPETNVIGKMAIDNYSKASGMQKNIFSTKLDAEKWLDNN